MADNKKVTELTLVNVVKVTDLLYMVTDDATTGEATSVQVSAEKFLSMTVTGTNRIISGRVAWTGTGYTFESINLTYEINGNIYISHGDQVTNTTPDATNPRLDVIFADSSGLGIKAGTPAASPAEPSLDNPESELKTNLVLVNNGTTTPSEITLKTIYDENLQESGGEWDTATSSARIDLANTSSPLSGSKDVKTLSALNDDYFSLSTATPITFTAFQGLTQQFRSLSWWKSDYIEVQFYDGVTLVGTAEINRTDFPTDDLVTIYTVDISSANLTWKLGSATEFDEIRYVIKVRQTTNNAEFQFDVAKLEYGGTTTTPSLNLVDGGNAFTVY